MVNFRDPAVVAKDNFALLKLWHVVDGIFLWEFITTLNFELSFIQGRRSYRWTIWIYSFSRMATLATVIANLILLNLGTPVSCTFSTPVIFASVSAYLALAAASLLLVIRVIAIWNRNKVVVVIATTIWSINGAFFIRGISQFHYASGGHCKALNVQDTKIAMIVSFLADVSLLIIMLVGLFRLDSHRNGASATGRILWNQCVIWLLLATVAGIVPTVFACLDLNEPLSTIFRIPWIIAMSIAATRMYRALNVALSSDIHCSAHVPSHNGGGTITVSGIWGSPAVPVSLNGIKVDVDVHTSDNHFPTSQAIRHSLDSNMDNQPQDKPHELV